MGKRKTSLRAGLLTVVLMCWLMPVGIIVALSGVLLGNSYQSSLQQEIRTDAENALYKVRMQLEDAIWDSKGVSYDGVVRGAYREYIQRGDSAQLYRTTSDYISKNFARESRYRAAFIRFWGDAESASVYTLCRGLAGYDLLQQCQQAAPQIVEAMSDTDTEIRFHYLDDQLYMSRNLLDGNFRPYATVVLLLEPTVFFQSVEAIGRVSDLRLTIDDCLIPLVRDENGRKTGSEIRYTVDIDGHTLAFSAFPEIYNFWLDTPWLRWVVLGVALLVLPLLLAMIAAFHRNVSNPIEALSRANALVQSGQRGYQIGEEAPNAEFGKLYANFNTMSAELKNQFERIYLEQQAAQRAQIKALQSQINPHFLNNTLEVISWEARLANNQRVCAMIEALSTMLTAALNRDGRSQIPLQEELGYVDAYLYIIRERLGGGLEVVQEIAPGMGQQLIPRLILQPIVENAVEHDITANRGCRLILRARQEDGEVILEVEHDGVLTEADREKIHQLSSPERPKEGRVGLRNVYRRLKLLYGDAGALSIEEVTQGTILAQIRFPAK
ncbi:MAG TPA: histidine kinase [Candidatus Faecousia intestinigallinarum]|nr:histidine kinase [Candidatus Faecousia intestinigallinarum]